MKDRESSDKMLKWQGVFKHYDWGGKTFLPWLLHQSNPGQKPYAEYWLSADTPYLLKVLDVEKMLSIQVHPSREVARKKFEEENRKGIPLDAPHRNYKDRNHKPELLSPLGDFYLLHGFKEPEKLAKILDDVPELNFLRPVFNGGDYAQLYRTVMTLPQEEVNSRLRPLLNSIITEYHAGRLEKTEEHFWAARAALSFNKEEQVDRGIFSIYLFNLIKLQEGEALFQAAGQPHAYLEGQTVEIMANSDNVLRGGLTVKHIDVPELLENTLCQPTVPHILKGHKKETQEEVYLTPADDFQLSRIRLAKGEGIAVPALSTDIYFVYTGNPTARADEQELPLQRGDALKVSAGAVVHFAAGDSEVTIYRATQPSIV